MLYNLIYFINLIIKYNNLIYRKEKNQVIVKIIKIKLIALERITIINQERYKKIKVKKFKIIIEETKNI